jgi:16S rRNA processing protein RimM
MKAPASIRVGFVRRAVGLAGEVEVEPLGDNPARFLPGRVLRLGRREVEVERATAAGQLLRLALAGVGDRDTAESLRGKYLEVEACDLPELPEGAYYQWQLIGLAVSDAMGRPLGELVEVLDYPANDVYRVVGDGLETLVPAIREVVLEVDLEAGRMVVDLPAAEDAG